MKTLHEIHDWINTQYMREMGVAIDKNTVHSYIEVYESLFSPYRKHDHLKMLEVGISTGGSMILWSNYFPSSASITGIDIQFEQLAHNALAMHSRATLLKGNSIDKEFVKTLGTYDIIVDDGSHQVDDQIATFNNLVNHLNVGGIYVIEDIDGGAISKIQLSIPEGQILDLRANKGRWDDVLMVYRKDNP